MLMKLAYKKRNDRGLTLTELLVSSMLMGIVMLGIAGFSVAIKRMQDSTDKRALLAYQTAVAMAFIERGVSQTFGSRALDGGYTNGAPAGANSPIQGTAGNPPDCNRVLATFCYDNANPQTYWSFRIDPNNTPTNYVDDSWFIIFSNNNGVDRNSLNGCIQPDGVAPGFGPIPDQGQTPCGLNRIILVYRALNQNLNPNAFVLRWIENNSGSDPRMYVEVTVNVIYAGSGTADALDNPTYSMQTRIPLLQYSTNLM